MERIKIGVVGLNFGRHMVGEIRERASAYFEVAAVCDTEFAKAEAVASETGAKAYGSLEELLADGDIPAIGLFTGPVGRAACIRKIINAGKDVMTTKPFELDPEAARAVLEEAERLGRVVHLNSPSPFPAEDMAKIAEWREKYNLGRPIACRCSVWSNYREQADGTWYDDPARCPAPPIYRLGIYLINDLVQLLGEPESIHLMQSRIFTGRPTSDTAQMSVRFANGALANVFSSFCVDDGQNHRNALELNFENGTVYRNIGPLKPGVRVGETVNPMQVVAGGGNLYEECVLRGHSGDYLWDRFYQAVTQRNLAAEVGADIVAAGVRIMEAMQRAQWTDGVIRL
ncbi:MAG: Gfo/Idh/MocA family oxidoreductase [Clostridiales bacterium]|jgi:predicted dehydrogenase|nr:Gfo/Idh/MocA family oxidoreductase [Clostridiales bacterium]